MPARRGLLPALAVVLTAPLAAESPAEMDAPTLYQRACACHGADGGGLAPGSPLADSFETLPASFRGPPVHQPRAR